MLTARVLVFFIPFVFCLLSTATTATERTLTGEEIKAFLPQIVARGSNTYQTFEANGDTHYSSAGRESKGLWTIKNNQYCSQWPPSPLWVCYKVIINKEKNRIYWQNPKSSKSSREENLYEIKKETAQ